MSSIQSSKELSELFDQEIESSVTNDDLSKMFRNYRSNAELTNAKYKEAKVVVDRLKEEIMLSHEMEKSQRMRINSLQSRLNTLEGRRKMLDDLAEKQRNSSKDIRKLEESITHTSKLVQELKQKFQEVITSTMKEIDVIKENKHLRSVLATKEAELHKLESGMSEKEEVIRRFAMENEEMKKDIETSKSRANDMKEHYDKIVNANKQQLLKYERIIEEMEKERRSLLGDYDIVNTRQDQSNSTGRESYHRTDKGFTCPDSTVTCMTEVRENSSQPPMDSTLNKKMDQIQGQDDANGDRNAESTFHFVNSEKGNRNSLISKFGFKKKPKLDFLDSIGESSAINSQPQTKKRLYSHNSNHYIG